MLRFMGIGRRTILSALLLEAALVAACGSLIGVALAVAASAVTNAYFGRFFETTLIFSLVTPGIVVFSVTLSLLLGVGAGALAAWRLARSNPLILWGRG
jgi:putative ABC transport system permease protein